jgi:hypothetical protein
LLRDDLGARLFYPIIKEEFVFAEWAGEGFFKSTWFLQALFPRFKM